MAAMRFLVFRFRLDSWWFGVPLLVRGPLINLPVVLATDFPPIQVVCIAMILTTMMVPRGVDRGDGMMGYDGWPDGVCWVTIYAKRAM